MTRSSWKTTVRRVAGGRAFEAPIDAADASGVVAERNALRERNRHLEVEGARLDRLVADLERKRLALTSELATVDGERARLAQAERELLNTLGALLAEREAERPDDETAGWRTLQMAHEILTQGAAADPVASFYLSKQLAALDFGIWRGRLAPAASRVERRLDLRALDNVRENSGPLPIDGNPQSPRDVLGTMQRGWKGSKRKTAREGLEGFSPDDAIFDEDFELWQLWSNARLAAVLADATFARHESPRVLELGCGPAFLFFFLTRYGIQDYVGLDGNPLILRFLRHVRTHEQHFRLLNLAEPVELRQGPEPVTFETLISFEVLEHLHERDVPTFLETVARHMHDTSLAFLTASRLADDEIDTHLTVHDRTWWLERFADAGLHPSPDAQRLESELVEAHPWNWDVANTEVFVLGRGA